ncbi:MAG: ParA family protein [Planctomycetota bacterium]
MELPLAIANLRGQLAIRICLINQKGGCGKSSSCFHLAGAFAAQGKRVLLVDADPQGSLSQGFLGSSAVESLPQNQTLANVFDESSFFSANNSVVIETGFEGILLAPTNQHLAQYNVPNPEKSGLEQFVLQQFLQDQPGVDLVLIDCPPNLYRCSWSAMLAADFVIVPVPPEDFGTQGLKAIHQAIQSARTLNPNLRRLGHLITRADRRLLIHRSYETRLRKAYADLVLTTVIPELSAFKVATAARMPVEYYQPSSVAANLTRALAHEILDRVSEKLKLRDVA